MEGEGWPVSFDNVNNICRDIATQIQFSLTEIILLIVLLDPPSQFNTNMDGIVA